MCILRSNSFRDGLCYQSMMATLKWITALALLGYLGVLVLMYFAQRSLMYFPDPVRRTPASVGLPQAEEVTLDTPDGERLLVWHVVPRDGKPVVLYFQGNGGGLDLRANRFRNLTSDGTGLVALNYRGYGGSTGSPTEAGLITDAQTAHAFAAARYAPERLVLWGESLGTGVAVALAATRPVGRVLLESPYTSTVDVAASIYPIIPVRLLMKDQFRSDERIAQVDVPVLILHGALDRIIPIRFGERLYGMVRGSKQFIRLPQADHNDHEKFGATEMVRPFILGQSV
jgi:fermentation-respiration switch protein FrsA (DUF1100 family)